MGDGERLHAGAGSVEDQRSRRWCNGLGEDRGLALRLIGVRGPPWEGEKLAHGMPAGWVWRT